MKTESTLA